MGSLLLGSQPLHILSFSGYWKWHIRACFTAGIVDMITTEVAKWLLYGMQVCCKSWRYHPWCITSILQLWHGYFLMNVSLKFSWLQRSRVLQYFDVVWLLFILLNGNDDHPQAFTHQAEQNRVFVSDDPILLELIYFAHCKNKISTSV